MVSVTTDIVVSQTILLVSTIKNVRIFISFTACSSKAIHTIKCISWWSRKKTEKHHLGSESQLHCRTSFSCCIFSYIDIKSGYCFIKGKKGENGSPNKYREEHHFKNNGYHAVTQKKTEHRTLDNKRIVRFVLENEVMPYENVFSFFFSSSVFVALTLYGDVLICCLAHVLCYFVNIALF